MKVYTLAQIAYETYCDNIGRSGNKLFPFKDLEQKIKDAWYAVAEAVYKSIPE